MIIYTPPKAMKTIPIVDLSDATSAAGRQGVAWEIHKACRESGFFYIVGHGIPAARLEKQLGCARQFFALPMATKMSVDIARSTNMRGYEPIGIQTLDEGSSPDLKEGFMSGLPGPLTDREPGQYEGPNQWPAEEPYFVETVLDFNHRMIAVGRVVASLLALSLDLNEDHFAQALSDPSSTIRLLRYPPNPQGAAANQLGCGAHSDWGFMTLLLQDSIGGLEVRNRDGDWVRATPIPGSLLVNLGDAMPILTNGLYHSTMHRVLNNTSDRDRYSIINFLDPPPNYIFDCVPTCRPNDGSFIPLPRSMGEHIQAMFELSYGS